MFSLEGVGSIERSVCLIATCTFSFSENSENLQPNKKWEDLTQVEKDFCTKKSEEAFEEFKEQQKYEKYTSKPALIFLSGILLIIYIIFRMLRYFLKRR